MRRALPEITIDRNTGAVCVASIEVRIVDGMARDAVVSQLSGFYRGNTDHRNGYEWLSFGDMAIKDMPAGISLCLFEGRLEHVSFGVSLPDMQFEQNWPTRESSQREVSFMREFLREQLGRKCVRGGIAMPWGEAWSSFDEKGFCASSGLRYKRPKKSTTDSP
jgi:hypothetical protein